MLTLTDMFCGAGGSSTDTLVASGLWTRRDAQTTQRDVALQLLEEATPHD